MVTKFFGIESINRDAQRFIIRGTGLFYLANFTFFFTQTFLFLYALETLSFAEFGIVLAIRYGIQAIADYPTGVVGDWISQRVVLSSAFIFYCLTFLIIGLASNFLSFAIAFVLLALGNSQESGAYEAWFDNNFKLFVYEDAERKIFSEYIGKRAMGQRLVNASAMIIGGLFSSQFGRQIIFLSQGAFYFIVALLFLRYLVDHPQLERKSSSMSSFFELLGDGLKYSLNNRTLLMIITGLVIWYGIGVPFWFHFLLFPFYESYGKTDEHTSLARSIIYIMMGIAVGLAGIFIRRLSNASAKKLLSFNMLVKDILFYGSVILLLTMFPAPDHFDLISFLALIIIFGFSATISECAINLLLQRIYIDLIPDENRNSIYSLIPTLSVFLRVPVLLLGGVLLQFMNVVTILIFIIGINFTGALLVSIAVFNYRETPNQSYQGGIRMNFDLNKIKFQKYGPKDHDYKIKYKPMVYTERGVIYPLDHLLGMVFQYNPATYQQFVTQLTSKVQSMIKTNYVKEKSIDVAGILENYENLKSYPELGEAMINFSLNFCKLPKNGAWEKEEIEHPNKYIMRGLLFSRYYAVLALTEVMDKETAIELFKKHIEDFSLNHPRIPKIETIEIHRSNFVEGTHREIRIISEIINGKFIIRKDTCSWYEVMKEVNDPELAYFVACFGDYAGCKARNENFVLTRNYTLMQGHPYCDEVYHDTRIDSDVTHPPKEFFDNLWTKSQ
ncbi:MAG: MFS transporter [Candidatus Hodarchaeota archaeon]